MADLYIRGKKLDYHPDHRESTFYMFRFALFIILEITVFIIKGTNQIILTLISFKSENKVNLLIVVLVESTFCLISGTG